MSSAPGSRQSSLSRIAEAQHLLQSSSTSRLMHRLQFIRSARLVIGATSGVLWSSLAFLGTLVLWMWADVVLDLSPRLRMLGWGLAVVLPGILLLRHILASRSAAAATAVAATLDQLTASGGQIRAGLDLAEDLQNSRMRTASPLSGGLAELAVQKAGLLAVQTSDQQAASPVPVLKSGAVLFVFCFAAVVMAASMPRMAWTELKRFFDPWGGHAAWSQYEFHVTPEQAVVAYGDSLEFSATVTGPPFEQLEMVIIPSSTARAKDNAPADVENVRPIDVLPMFPDAAGSWHASLADIREPFDFFLRVRRARSETRSVSVFTVPAINDVQVEITAPLYTGLSVFRGTMPTNGLEGLPGTEVRVIAGSNRPLTAGTLLVQMDDTVQTVAMTIESDPHRVAGTFLITQPGRLDISIVDEAEQSSASPFSVPVRVLEDQSPMVRLTQPRPVSFATPNAAVPIIVAAEDDYGLHRCQLFRSLNNSRPLPVDLAFPTVAPRRAQLQTQLPLAEYDLQPGDEIRLFARVEDNDPNGPAAPIGKGSESSIVSIRIISEEDFNRAQQQQAGMEMMTSRHQQARRRMEGLAEKMKALKEKLDAADPDSAVAEEARKEMEQLSDEMQKAAEALQAMADKPLPFELDKELAPQLAEMAEMLKKMSEQTSEMSKNQSLSSKQASKEMQEQIDAMQQRQEQHKEEAMKPLEHLAQVLPLKQDEAAFTQLVQRQRALADRLQSLKDKNADADPATRARMRELEEEQHKLRQQLMDLLQRIEENIDRLPDDPELDELRNTAQDFVNGVLDSGADSMMADAEEALTAFDGETGSSMADQAATTLETFLSKCSGMGQACNGACQKFSPGSGSSMSETLSQLAPGMGTKMGSMGMGTGSGGGYSAQSSTMENVGMYGTTPLMDASQASLGNSDSSAPVGVMTTTRDDDNGESGSDFSGNQTSSAFGNAETGVPSQYRRQAGQYMQKLAEELEE